MSGDKQYPADSYEVITDIGNGWGTTTRVYPTCTMCGQENDTPSVDLCSVCRAYLGMWRGQEIIQTGD